MTKEESHWIYGSIVVAVAAFAFLLYLISDVSPLAKSDAGVDLNTFDSLQSVTNTPAATSEVTLDLGE